MQHQKGTVSVLCRRTFGLKIAGPLQTWSKVEVHSMNYFCMQTGLHLWKFIDIWSWCNTFDNGEREFDDKLKTGRQAHRQRAAMCVVQVPLSGKTGAFS